MYIFRLFQSLEDCFGDLPDPRVVGRCDHVLVDIIMVTVCGNVRRRKLQRVGGVGPK